MTDKVPTEKPGAEKLKIDPKIQEPGEGIRSLRTSTAFRALNFELYAKPNKFTMALGLIGVTVCMGYIIYMNYNYDRSKYYVAEKDDGSAVLQPKKSRWET